MSAAAELRGDRLAMAGQITATNVLRIRRQGEEWLTSLPGGTDASVDLSSLSGASSVLLSLLLCLKRLAERREVRLSFAGASEDLLGLARLNGVSHWLTGHG